jgi:Lysophospholipase
MAIHEIDYPSFNGRDNIQAWIYVPIRKPRGIVQLVHGFGEHSRRYLHMILALNEAGFVVCANDHVGHGKTALVNNSWGDWGYKGYMTTAEDENTLRSIVCEKFPGLPYFMFGHSWGSMIARNYAANFGEGMTGLVICGTCGIMDVSALESVLKEQLDAGKGAEANIEYLGSMFAGMTDRYENPQTPNDWISGDPDVVIDHATDPFNSFAAPTNQSLYDFVSLIRVITGPDWAAKVPAALPVYNIAGDMDPVGSYGEGVYMVSNWLAGTGHKVLTRLYSQHRHEIHNDRDIRDQVVNGIIDFFNSLL